MKSGKCSGKAGKEVMFLVNLLTLFCSFLFKGGYKDHSLGRSIHLINLLKEAIIISKPMAFLMHCPCVCIYALYHCIPIQSCRILQRCCQCIAW